MNESKAKVEFSNGFVIKSMELRDYFAVRAMQGMMSLEQLQMRLGRDLTMEQIAGVSYEWADAMLKAREEK
jgi:hypothetical protein